MVQFMFTRKPEKDMLQWKAGIVSDRMSSCKKLLLMILALLVIAPDTVTAQIELDSGGRVGIGSAGPVSTSQMQISSSLNSGLNINLDGSTAFTNYGARIVNQNGFTGSIRYGLLVESISPSAVSYSITGEATGGVSGNIGLRGLATGGGSAIGVYGQASGGSGNYAGYFSGDVHATGVVTHASDSRLKRDVETISNKVIDAFYAVTPVSYRFADIDELRSENIPTIQLPSGLHYGVVAQQVKEILPSLVKDVNIFNPNDDNINLYVSPSVNYTEFIPILIAVIQDQQAQMEALQLALLQAGIDVPISTRK